MWMGVEAAVEVGGGNRRGRPEPMQDGVRHLGRKVDGVAAAVKVGWGGGTEEAQDNTGGRKPEGCSRGVHHSFQLQRAYTKGASYTLAALAAAWVVRGRVYLVNSITT